MSFLDADVMIDQAQQATGLDDPGPDDGWREGLDRLVDALNTEAKLNAVGEMVAAGEIVGYLATRLGIVGHATRVAAAEIRAPIVVIGQARTGTTILHDLLAQDPAHRVPLAWEVDRPCPPPSPDTYETDPRIAEVQAQQEMAEALIPGFQAMHPIGAQLAQECVRMTGSAFRSIISGTQYRVPSHARWVLYEADMAPAYRWHRTFLRHLGSRHMADRWVLKSPAHIWSLPALLREYPDALLVQTHRDPLRVIASVSSLIAFLRRMATDETTIPDAAAEWADYILDGFDRSVDARFDGTVQADRVVDVRFGDFMADPFGTIGTIYDRFGLVLTAEAESRMRTFLDEHPQQQHRYSFADTGLDTDALRERARRYQDHFGVASEPAG